MGAGTVWTLYLKGKKKKKEEILTEREKVKQNLQY